METDDPIQSLCNYQTIYTSYIHILKYVYFRFWLWIYVLLYLLYAYTHKVEKIKDDYIQRKVEFDMMKRPHLHHIYKCSGLFALYLLGLWDSIWISLFHLWCILNLFISWWSFHAFKNHLMYNYKRPFQLMLKGLYELMFKGLCPIITIKGLTALVRGSQGPCARCMKVLDKFQ